MANPFENDTDDHVVQRAAGGANRGTIEEMTRRLKCSIDALDQNVSSLRSATTAGQATAERLNRGIFWFTVALFFLGAVQLGLFVYQVFFQHP